MAFGLANGSAFVTTTTERMPSSIVEQGLFVQLFDSAGAPTGKVIRVDDPATSVVAADDYSQSSIQSDGAGGFHVVWKSDVDGDGESDGLVIRHYNAAGEPLGDALSLDSIPDRIYDEGEAVTLYTSGLFADPDPGDVLTFSAAGLPDGLTIDPASGVISGTADAGGLFSVTVTATDAGGLAASTSFEVFVIGEPEPVNAAPTALAFTNTTTLTPENGDSIKVADLLVTDDGLGSNVFGLSGADAASFSIVGGSLYFNGSGDFETKPGYDVTVSVSDPLLPDAPVSQNFHLDLSDVDESTNHAPTAVGFVNTVASTPENGFAVKVADIVVTDDALGSNVLASPAPMRHRSASSAARCGSPPAATSRGWQPTR